MKQLTLTRDEVLVLTGYIEKCEPVEPDDVERAVLAKLEAITTAPESDG